MFFAKDDHADDDDHGGIYKKTQTYNVLFYYFIGSQTQRPFFVYILSATASCRVVTERWGTVCVKLNGNVVACQYK